MFDPDAVVAFQDPAYPVYVDTNVIAGRGGALVGDGLFEQFEYMACTEENGFVPEVPSRHVDMIYLCSPNNPTGAVATHAQLERFVEYALAHEAIIVFDAAYEIFIQEPRCRARSTRCRARAAARSSSAPSRRRPASPASGSAGRSSRRGCAIDERNPRSLNELWNRRTTTFFNGASNVVQEGGLASLTPEGQRAERRDDRPLHAQRGRDPGRAGAARPDRLRRRERAVRLGEVPARARSWDFFDKLLREAYVVTTPGAGFGAHGEGFLRLSAFGHPENIAAAVESIERNVRL